MEAQAREKYPSAKGETARGTTPAVSQEFSKAVTKANRSSRLKHRVLLVVFILGVFTLLHGAGLIADFLVPWLSLSGAERNAKAGFLLGLFLKMASAYLVVLAIAIMIGSALWP